MHKLMSNTVLYKIQVPVPHPTIFADDASTLEKINAASFV